MDQIHVSDATLSNSAAALQQLADKATNITATCVQQVSSLLPELDVNFRESVEEYIADVQDLGRRIIAFVYDNLSAINERIAKLAEYETHGYSKRIIG